MLAEAVEDVRLIALEQELAGSSNHSAGAAEAELLAHLAHNAKHVVAAGEALDVGGRIEHNARWVEAGVALKALVPARGLGYARG